MLNLKVGLKSSTSVVLAVIMAISMQLALNFNAAAATLIDDNFDTWSAPTGHGWDILPQNGVISVSQNPVGASSGDIVVKMNTAAANQLPVMSKTLPSALPGSDKTILEYSIMRSADGIINSLEMRDANNKGIYFLMWDRDGKLKARSSTGTSEPIFDNALSLNNWHRIVIILDIANAQYNLFLDGQQSPKSYSLSINPNAELTNLRYLRLGVTGQNMVNANIYFNDIRMYTTSGAAVSITSPSPGTTIDASSKIEITADARMGNNLIKSVTFYCDGLPLENSTDTDYPYSYTWINPPAGDHSLTAIMTDSAGQTFASAPVSITVTVNIYKETPIIRDDFESFTGGQPSGYGSSGNAVNIDFEHGTSLELKVTQSQTENEMRRDLGSGVSGKIKISGEFYFSDTTHRRPIFITRDSSNQNENYFLIADKTGSFYKQPGNIKLMDYMANKWYEISVIIDCDTHTYQLHINGVRYVLDETLPNTAFSNIRYIYVAKEWDGATGDGLTYLDNVGVFTLVEKPRVTSVTVLYGQDEITDLTSVPTGSDAIVVRFNKDLNQTTLNTASIRLTLDSKIVDYTGSYNAGTHSYTMRLNEVLKPARVYKIAFGDGIISSDNMNMDSMQMNFRTRGNVINSIDLKANGAVINSLSSLKPGDTVTACTVMNNTGDVDADAILIIALYKDGQLFDVQENRQKLSAGTSNLEVLVSITLPQDAPSGYTIKAFGWQDPVNMVPYADAVCIGQTE